MSLTPKQERFAREYVVDFNASAAARRAGYSQRTARQLGSRNLQHPGVQQLISKLTASKFEELGIEQGESVFWTKQLWEMSAVLQPKIWKGQPVVWVDPESGESELVMEVRSAAGASKALEMRSKMDGVLLKRPEASGDGLVVYKLKLDRDLSAEGG